MIRLVLDRTSLLCLAILVVVPAWVFGGIEATLQTWLLVIALVGVATATLNMMLASEVDDQQGSIPWLAYALIGAIAFGAIQLIPLDSSILRALSPTTHNWWTELAAYPADASAPISVYPAGTRQDMSTLTLILMSMILASLSVNSSSRRLYLCMLLAANGAAMAFFGMVQQLTSEPDTIYWTIPLTLGGHPFAGFVNRNNGAGYLNMCLGLSIGFFLWSVTRFSMTANHRLAPDNRPSRFRVRATEILASLDTTSVLAMTATVFIAAGVLSTLSRGGALALLGAAVTTLVVTAILHRGIVPFGTMAGMTIVGLALTIWLGRAELLQERFVSLFDGDSIAEKEVRLPHWKDAISVVRDFPISGTGIGTYRFAYEPYETRSNMAWHVHAENQYVESAVEGGLIGFTLLLVCLALACWSSCRILVVAGDAETHAFGFAALFVLASQMIHAVFDFGLYMPSNAILLSVVCGTTASCVRRHGRLSERWFFHTEKWLSVIVALLVFGAGLMGLREMRAVACVEQTSRQLRQLSSEDLLSPQVLRSRIQQLRSALAVRPDDAYGQYRLARLWTTLFRVEAAAQMRDSLPSLTDDERMALTTLETLFLRAQTPEFRAKLVKQKFVKMHLKHAWLCLQKARKVCPVMSKTHLLMAQLSPLFEDSSSQDRHIANALRTSPGDPTSLFDIGLLKLYAGQTDEGVALWRKCLDSTKSFRDKMIAIGTRTLGPVEFYRQLLIGMPEQIVDVAKREYRGDQNRNLRLELAALAEQQLIDQQASDPTIEPRYDLMGAIYVIREDWSAAAAAYEEALKQSSGNLEWRYELARAYQLIGDLANAKRHSSIGRQLGGPNARNFEYLLKTIQAQIDQSKRKSSGHS